ncbi:helix-turn-helix transcriptional regulator [Roseibacillus persicicus]|uniref:helix-turn-helix transcriptional regulator n=1 Tax=Roseibacillus persicicus TaxID=454148 RepID=UPI00280CEC97|nr:helix-turn-helix domain-containing protein [Roseibacillus persicicus]MDQ8192453.1 helix-turn-helix domain-containing protein [Roseibacillus persicicus]
MSPTEPTRSITVNHDPVYIRIPEAVQLFGIGRTTLYALISSRKIKTVLLKQKGHKTGRRLVCFESLKAYLDGQAEGGDA